MESTSAPPPGHDHGFDIAEAVADAVFVVGPDSRILSWSSGAERMYGVSAADAVGRW